MAKDPEERRKYYREYSKAKYWANPEKERQRKWPNAKKRTEGHETARIRQHRREDYVRTYLEQHPCVRCGFSDSRALQFHHRDPAVKEYTVSQMAKSRVAEEKIVAEIAKCDILCANCHWITHAELRIG